MTATLTPAPRCGTDEAAALARRLAIQAIHRWADVETSRIASLQAWCKREASHTALRRMLDAIRTHPEGTYAQQVVVKELTLLPQVQAYFDRRAQGAIEEVGLRAAHRVAAFDFGGAWPTSQPTSTSEGDAR